MSAIHFDSNALIALPLWVRADHPVIQRVQQGTPAAACALFWYEFVCGPVSDEHKQLARALLAGPIEPVTERDAELAGQLFNANGRIRRTRTDAFDRILRDQRRRRIRYPQPRGLFPVRRFRTRVVVTALVKG